MENKKESTEVLFRHLLLRRCTDAEREKAETRALILKSNQNNRLSNYAV